MISIRQLLNTAPKDGTYIEVFIMTPPYAVIRNVYWCQDAADWAEGGRIFNPPLPATATWRLMDEAVDTITPSRP